ncbi:MAG: hypothetical protein GXP24_15075 [Planctomycetes bacterium]|nr:hypothetical protein [Planctomycetota bacterium]
MRPWDFDTSAARMRKATEDLQVAWEQTTEQWHDEVSRKFCEQHLEPIGPAMKLSLDAVGRMQQLMNQIQNECER